MDNASGHFRLDSSSLGKVEELFLKKYQINIMTKDLKDLNYTIRKGDDE